MSPAEVGRILSDPCTTDACQKLLAWGRQQHKQVYWTAAPMGSRAPGAVSTMDLYVAGVLRARAGGPCNSQAARAIAWKYLESLDRVASLEQRAQQCAFYLRPHLLCRQWQCCQTVE